MLYADFGFKFSSTVRLKQILQKVYFIIFPLQKPLAEDLPGTEAAADAEVHHVWQSVLSKIIQRKKELETNRYFCYLSERALMEYLGKAKEKLKLPQRFFGSSLLFLQFTNHLSF